MDYFARGGDFELDLADIRKQNPVELVAVGLGAVVLVSIVIVGGTTVKYDHMNEKRKVEVKFDGKKGIDSIPSFALKAGISTLGLG